MSMRTLERLRDMLCEELDSIAEQGELNVGALDIIDKLVHSIKNIDKICMGEGYRRRWDAEGFMRGNSYKRDSMGVIAGMTDIAAEITAVPMRASTL